TGLDAKSPWAPLSGGGADRRSRSRRMEFRCGVNVLSQAPITICRSIVSGRIFSLLQNATFCCARDCELPGAGETAGKSYLTIVERQALFCEPIGKCATGRYVEPAELNWLSISTNSVGANQGPGNRSAVLY